ncbi:MAG: DUF2752 domain-containing protein [Planctomycetaceae bacterium]|nr:DUF2752 domain-containing protein [Planctomycetaceae bacterium]
MGANEMTFTAGDNPADPPPLPAAPSRWMLRVRGVSLLLPCLAVLAAAFFELPKRVDLPPCSFWVNTHLPCPGCGMTRSMMEMGHGHIVAAFNFHPFGVVLFSGLVAVSLIAGAELVTARDLWGRINPSPWWLAAAVGLLTLSWLWMLISGWLGFKVWWR